MNFPGQLRTAFDAAGPMILAGLGAHLAVVLMSGSPSHTPIFTAVASSFVFASVLLAFGYRGSPNGTGSIRPAILRLQTDGFALVAIGAGAWVISVLLGSGAAFYCEPQVPWRIEIALFGSFCVGVLTFPARAHKRARTVYPLAMVALLWIAPFYGFFSTPLFLAISVNSACSERPVTMVMLTALGMLAGEQMGRSVAKWMGF